MDKEQIIELSNQGLSPSQIAKKLNIKVDRAFYISKRYGKLNHHNRLIHTRNENYFEKIDSDTKAYFLGLIYSDGNIHKDLKRIRIKLIEPDKYLLELLAKDINYNGPLYFSKKNEKMGNHDFYSLEIYSPKIVKDLINIGLYPKKSLTIDFPTQDKIPEEYMCAFVRGYFDGDGGYCWSRDKYITLQLCVSEKFGIGLKNFLENKLNIHCTLFQTKHSIWKVSISGYRQCLIFSNYIYSNGVHMNRKYDKYLEIIDFYKKIRERVKNKKTSKYIGVYFSKYDNRFISFVKLNNKRIRFGQFKDEIEAAKAYNEGIKKLNLDRNLNIFN